MVRIPNEFHHIRTPAALLRVPEAQSLRLDVPVNKPADGRTEGLFLVASDPDEVPVRRLNAGAERRAKAGSSAHAHAAFVQARSVRNTSELELTGP